MWGVWTELPHGSCYYNKRWNCDSAVNVLVPWGLEWAGIKAPWQVNSSSLGEKPDPWPLDLVMVRSNGFRKLLSRMSKTENKGLRCVCSHEFGRWSRGPQSVGWSRWGDVRVFSVAWERRCSCATSLQATANKWIFFFHLPISRILFYSPFTGELGEMAVERKWTKTYAHDLHCSNALQKYIDQR